MKEQLRNWLFNNLANVITTLRLISSVWLVKLAISNEQLGLMFILVHVCVITDVADGLVARRFNIESRFGAFLDRLADKIFICPTIIILVYRFWPIVVISSTLRSLTEGLVIVIVILEIFLIVSGILGLIKGVYITSNQWGRGKMACQSASIYIWFLSLVIEHHFKIRVLYLSIYLIDIILFIAIGLAIKSIEGYYQRWQKT